MTQEELQMNMLKSMVAEINRLEDLCSRAADALEEIYGEPYHPDLGGRKPYWELIAQLRKAAIQIG
jgi:hypothetical protein